MHRFVSLLVLLTLLPMLSRAGAQPLLYEFTSPKEQPHGYFGWSAASVPDVDGDGLPDLLIGALLESSGASPDSSGRVYVFNGVSRALLHTLASPNEEPSGFFGYTVSGLSDVNGDGFGDLLVGAPWESPGDSPELAGRAYVFSGADGGLLHELNSENEQEGGLFGNTVASVPDTDGDGIDDLLVGAPNESYNIHVPIDNGRAYLFSGADGQLLRVFSSPGVDPYQFGKSLSGASDLDGDGRGEVVIGSPYEEAYDMPPVASGKAYVFSGASGVLIHSLISDNIQIAGFFGDAVASLPDIDDDGVDDILIGARGEGNAPSVRTGRAYTFSGASGSLLHTINSPNGEHDGRFAHSVAAVPDVDGDGFSDLLIGSYESPGSSPIRAGRAYVFSGNSGALLHEFASPHEQESSLFSSGVAGVPDVDGDGHGDVLVGAAYEAPGMKPGFATGRAYLFSGMAEPVSTEAPPEEGVPAAAAPNPASERASVSFSLEAASAVRLALYDVIGREVASVKVGSLPIGRHRLGLDVSALPAGVYVWQLTADGPVESGRLTVAR